MAKQSMEKGNGMAKVRVYSPESHLFAVEQFCKLVGCSFTIGERYSWPGTDRQSYCVYLMVLTKDQAKRVRELFKPLYPTDNLSTLVKGVVDGYKASIDLDVAGMTTPTSGAIQAGRKLRELIAASLPLPS